MTKDRLLADVRYIETTLIRQAQNDRYQTSIDALTRIQTHLIYEFAAAAARGEGRTALAAKLRGEPRQ